jgi:hypothetical protein
MGVAKTAAAAPLWSDIDTPDCHYDARKALYGWNALNIHI